MQNPNSSNIKTSTPEDLENIMRVMLADYSLRQDKQIDSLNQQIQGLLLQSGQHKKKIEELEGENGKDKQQIAQLQMDSDQHKKKIRELECENNEGKRKIAAFEGRIAELESDRDVANQAQTSVRNR